MDEAKALGRHACENVMGGRNAAKRRKRKRPCFGLLRKAAERAVGYRAEAYDVIGTARDNKGAADAYGWLCNIARRAYPVRTAVAVVFRPRG